MPSMMQTDPERATTQCEKVRRHLDSGRGITQFQALDEYGIMRLASRVSDLKKQGYPVVREIIEVTARDGSKAHVAVYRKGEPNG